MMKKAVSLLLALALALGLTVPVVAAGPTFTDVPETHWAYADVEAVAAAGLMNGTGNGEFSPDLKVSVAQFLTLLGRLVFPDTKVTEGASWYGPYVIAARTNGLLEGTQVDITNVEAEISRYDMAVILRAAAKKLGVMEKPTQTSQVKDYGEIPTKYAQAVLAVYGMELIKGDQAGNFNGSNTMMRAEVATVIMRLAKAKPGSSQGGDAEPGATTEPETPVNVGYTLRIIEAGETKGVMVPGERTLFHCVAAPSGVVQYETSDDLAGFICTSSNPTVAEVTGIERKNWSITAVSEGSATITITDPYGASSSVEITVVSQRENMNTKTYTVTVSMKNEKHTLRGNAYTETTFLYDTPFKLYYTRDGGKTSQLVAEGRTPVDNGTTRNPRVELEVELPDDIFYGEDAGFYVSAEAELDGQRIVTSDLRTDGRAYIKTSRESSDGRIPMTAVLTSPEGEKACFTFKGYVSYSPDNESGYRYPEGFKVQLYHKNGTLIGEAITQGGGTFSIDCVVDALDGGFKTTDKLYYVIAEGTTPEGVKYRRVPGLMESLVSLHIEANDGGRTDHNYEVYLASLRDRVEN